MFSSFGHKGSPLPDEKEQKDEKKMMKDGVETKRDSWVSIFGDRGPPLPREKGQKEVELEKKMEFTALQRLRMNLWEEHAFKNS